jgi:GntR family transcriptional regulator
MAEEEGPASLMDYVSQQFVVSLIKLRRDTSTPLYQQIEDQLTALIVGGTLSANTILPPERQLAESLGVSRGTVQQCYGNLRERGLIHGHGRHGSIVSPAGNRVIPGKERLKGFTEEIETLGQIPSTRVLERDVVSDRSIASLFGLPSEARFLKLVRLRLADGRPISLESAWYSLTAAPALASADGNGSVYRHLEADGTPLDYCDQTIDAVMPSEEEVEVFAMSHESPCLLIRRKSYLGSGAMVEYVEGVFRGDVYSYRMRLDA